jgi:hypothetical protein
MGEFPSAYGPDLLWTQHREATPGSTRLNPAAASPRSSIGGSQSAKANRRASRTAAWMLRCATASPIRNS